MRASVKNARIRPMSTASLSIRPQQRDPLVVFLLCSLLFHLLLLLLFPVPNPIFPPETEQLTEVELLPAEEPQQLAQAELPAQAEPEALPQEEPVEEENGRTAAPTPARADCESARCHQRADPGPDAFPE